MPDGTVPTGFGGRSFVGTNGVHLPTIRWVTDWLRSEEAAEARAWATEHNIAPEHELAAVLARKWGLT